MNRAQEFKKEMKDNDELMGWRRGTLFFKEQSSNSKFGPPFSNFAQIIFLSFWVLGGKKERKLVSPVMRERTQLHMKVCEVSLI